MMKKEVQEAAPLCFGGLSLHVLPVLNLYY